MGLSRQSLDFKITRLTKKKKTKYLMQLYLGMIVYWIKNENWNRSGNRKTIVRWNESFLFTSL